MKIPAVFPAFLIVLCVVNPVFAKTADGEAYHNAFDRTVSYLKTNKTQSIVQAGQDGIEVTCTLLPMSQVLAVGWEIYNPGKKELDIKPGDIRIVDQIREYSAITPGEAAQTLYGTKYSPMTSDPFMDAAAPSSYTVPVVEPESKGADDVILSAFNFGKADSARNSGLIYYTLYGKNVKITATMKIGDETLKFDFN